MQYHRSFAAMLLLVLLTNCKDQAGETVAAPAKKDSIPVSGEGNVVIPSKDVSDLAPEVIIRDSSALLNYDQLLSLLPNPAGFEKTGDPSGEAYAKRTSGGPQSYIKQEYINKNDEKVLVEVIDYGMSRETLNGLITMYEKNSSKKEPGETNQQTSLSIDSRNQKAYLFVTESTSTSQLVYSLNDRFLVSITGQRLADPTQLKKIAQTINYQPLLKS